MKEQYNWDYKIKIKTKQGTYEYEKESLDNIGLLLEKYPDYEEVEAKKVDKCKKKVLNKPIARNK